MKKNCLEQHEIDAINLFVDEVSKIDVVEGVYIAPYQPCLANEQKARIVTIFNLNSDYNLLLGTTRVSRNPYDEIGQLTKIEKRYVFLFLYKSLLFRSENINNYSLPITDFKEEVSVRALVGGTILFDRFGNITRKKEEASRSLTPFDDAFKIDNIDSIKHYNNSLIQYKKEA